MAQTDKQVMERTADIAQHAIENCQPKGNDDESRSLSISICGIREHFTAPGWIAQDPNNYLRALRDLRRIAPETEEKKKAVSALRACIDWARECLEK